MAEDQKRKYNNEEAHSHIKRHKLDEAAEEGEIEEGEIDTHDTQKDDSRTSQNVDIVQRGNDKDRNSDKSDKSKDNEKDKYERKHKPHSSDKNKEVSDNRGDKNRERDRSRSKDHDRKRDKDKDDRLRDREKERDYKHKDRTRGKDKGRRTDRERDTEREREREHDKARDKDRDERERDGERRDKSREGRNRDRNSDKASRLDTNERKPKENTKSVDDLAKEEEEFKRKVREQLSSVNEEEETQKRLEESRRRRQEILAKYSQKATSQEDVATASIDVASPKVEDKEDKEDTVDQEFQDHIAKDGVESEKPNEADIDMEALEKEDREARLRFNDTKTREGTRKPIDEIVDIFSDSPLTPVAAHVAGSDNVSLAAKVDRSHSDNWDDAEGYYLYRSGEVLDSRFQVYGNVGRGVFSTVLRAKDISVTPNQDVAIKVIRNNDVMYKAGQKELTILSLLAAKDPEDKKHCIRLVNHFEFKNHLCLVFEPMSMNLREVVKRFGKSVGLNINAVRVYAKQLILSLKHLVTCNVLHADIKPDNIVVNEAKTVLKLCDFGSACTTEEAEITPYLVSRYYRAPEIILGLPYDHAIDMWSLGCCLAELYTGKILFPGRSNNEMLRIFMELRGKFPKKLLRKATFRARHFDENCNYLQQDFDTVSQKQIVRVINDIRSRDLLVDLMPPSAPKLSEKEHKKVLELKDLLERCLALDPAKRIQPKDALNHPFLLPY